ncbi:MAG TPA: S1C family serine protease [Candidatus Binatia bacterium]|nr:S1C family serine protease [Candidatus Binatia bacterium]
MKRVVTLTLAALFLLPTLAPGAPTSSPDRRLHPGEVSALPSFVRRVEPAVVALRVRNAEGATSSARLGSRRFGSGVIFDQRGYVLTVSYLLLDAVEIEARGRDGRVVAARVVGFDLDAGLGVVKLEGEGPWPAATLGDSRAVVPGARTGTVGVDEDNDLVQVTGAVHAVRRFSAYWEYMLDRAIIVTPASPQWGGSAVVNERGEVVGIASLRIGDPPHVNLAIPIEQFVPVKDELIASGRIASRPPRPWLGLYTIAMPEGLVVSELSPVGPASRAGFRQGDRILKVNGVAVASQEEFYEQLWSRRAGDLIELAVQRDNQVRVIAVPSVDRHRLYPVR